MQTTPPPYLVSWNLTKRCNLRCAHCYLDAVDLVAEDALSTEDAYRIADEITHLNPGAMVVLTGGEPLLRPDLFDIARRLTDKGATVVLGTNGTLLSEQSIQAIKESGIKGVGVSLDSCSPAFHDKFRGKDGSWEEALMGIKLLRDSCMDFQIHFSVMKENLGELSQMAEFAKAQGAMALNVFFLVCTGRGQGATNIGIGEYDEALKWIATYDAPSGFMVRSRCAPQFAIVAEESGNASAMAATSGCIAGTGYLRITPEGRITPCPYMSENNNSPSVLSIGLDDIWENGADFRQLREGALSGKCKDCAHSKECGGCRARALAASKGLMGEDPWCSHEPAEPQEIKAKDLKPVWTPEAIERLERAPAFVRGFVKTGVEKYAVTKGISIITPELLAELRAKAPIRRG